MLSKWLYQKVNKWDNITNKNISDELFTKMVRWINNQDDLVITIDIDKFRIFFYLYLNNYRNNEYYDDYEYFNLKYSDEIIDLFLFFKEVTKSHGSLLLHDKNNNSNDLLDFIHKHCEILEEEEENNDELYDEEKNIIPWD